jgi:hypothetical protein
MKKKTLDRVIDAILFEADVVGMPNVAYGIYDRPGPTEKAGPDFEPTVPPDVPIKPTEMMSNQLAVERPPIEDEDYVPTTVSDLRQAASAIAGMVPPEGVEKFYRRTLELLDDLETEEMTKNTGKPAVAAPEEETVKTESRFRRAGVSPRRGLRALLEALEGDLYSTRTGEQLRSRFDPEYGKSTYYDDDGSDYDAAIELDDDERPTAVDDDDESLEQLAAHFGYKTASGVRQALQRQFDLMKYLITQVGATTVENMMGTLVPEFVELGADVGLFDPEDVVDLMSSPVYVRELDSFRYYFNSLFKPVYQDLRKEKEKELRSNIASLGVPQAAIETVYNQVTGASARKDSTIAKKLEGSMSVKKVREILRLISENFYDLKKIMNDIPDDLVDRTIDRINSMSDGEKKKMILDAFREAGEFQEQFGEARSGRRRR